MRHCPICDERYDEDIIRFCTKDGTPLVDSVEPSFTALPSENAEPVLDDLGEETVIRRKTASDSPFDPSPESERYVIPTTPATEQQVRTRTVPVYYPPPQPPNTGKTVFLTILGTLVVLGFGAGLFWLLQTEAPSNANMSINVNLANQNTNLNTNLSFDSNFNFNTNANFNSNSGYNTNFNFNALANLATKTPTPKVSPSPSTSPSASPTPATSPTPRPTANTKPPSNAQPTPLGTPRTGPRPPPVSTPKPLGNN